MKQGIIRIESRGRIAEIFDRLEKAQEEIYKCYSELTALGVVVFDDEAAGAEGPAPGSPAED